MSIQSKNKAVVLRNEHPDWTLLQIGNEIGITKQRVWAILRTSNVPTKKIYNRPKCPQCGVSIPHDRKLCQSCRDEFYWAYVPCSACGKEIRMLKKLHKYYMNRIGNKNTYCCRTCYYAGRRDHL